MTMNAQKQQHGITTILDMPVEVITNICSNKVLKTTDIFNLAVSHPKLNVCLFNEDNSALWKTKYTQKYSDWNKNEFEIVINEHNTWRDEIMARMSLNKTVRKEIKLMPSKFLKVKHIPYHAYPFSEELNSNIESRQYYVYRATLDYYKHLENKSCYVETNRVMFMAHEFLIYVTQVYFGHKITKLLSLPLAEQIIDQAFYLLERYWCPEDDISFVDLRGQLNTTTLFICDELYTSHRNHPMFANGYNFGDVVRNGNSNLDHDLYDEENTKIILKCISKFLKNNGYMMCSCPSHVIPCFLLYRVLDWKNCSVFALCALYESITRRLGVKVKLTTTSVHNFVSWTSSWPGNKHKNNTCYLIDIANYGVMRKAKVCPVSRKLPENHDGNVVSDLFWTFSKTIEQLFIEDIATYKYVLDFQTLLRPDDTEVQSRYQKFHQHYEYCPCPLFRTSLNPLAPKHVDEKLNVYLIYPCLKFLADVSDSLQSPSSKR